jgi:hypothetical protein
VDLRLFWGIGLAFINWASLGRLLSGHFPFISVYFYAYGETAQSLCFCHRLIAELETELGTCCQGSLSEVYDADELQRPGSVRRNSGAWHSLSSLLIGSEIFGSTPNRNRRGANPRLHNTRACLLTRRICFRPPPSDS